MVFRAGKSSRDWRGPVSILAKREDFVLFAGCWQVKDEVEEDERRELSDQVIFRARKK